MVWKLIIIWLSVLAAGALAAAWLTRNRSIDREEDEL